MKQGIHASADQARSQRVFQDFAQAEKGCPNAASSRIRAERPRLAWAGLRETVREWAARAGKNSVRHYDSVTPSKQPVAGSNPAGGVLKKQATARIGPPGRVGLLGPASAFSPESSQGDRAP